MIKKLLDRLFPSSKPTDEEFDKRAKAAFKEALSKAFDDGERLGRFTYTRKGFGWSMSRTWTIHEFYEDGS